MIRSSHTRKLSYGVESSKPISMHTDTQYGTKVRTRTRTQGVKDCSYPIPALALPEREARTGTGAVDRSISPALSQ